jgi:hypothetical protein
MLRLWYAAAWLRLLCVLAGWGLTFPVLLTAAVLLHNCLWVWHTLCCGELHAAVPAKQHGMQQPHWYAA